MMEPATEAAAGRPWFRWLAAAAAAIVLGLLLVLAYNRGQASAGLSAAQVALERRELVAKSDRLERQNSKLNARVAELEMARKLDREAYGQVEQTLGELQSQLSRQADDLAFYKSIVSPADGVQGLRIHRFEVRPGAAPRDGGRSAGARYQHVPGAGE